MANDADNVSGRTPVPGFAFGGALAAYAGFETTATLTLVTAFLGGAILLNVLQEELPARSEARLGWFAAGLVITAVVLLGPAAEGHRGAA